MIWQSVISSLGLAVQYGTKLIPGCNTFELSSEISCQWFITFKDYSLHYLARELQCGFKLFVAVQGCACRTELRG